MQEGGLSVIIADTKELGAMKRYLILSVTAGNGHNAVANAIREEILSRDKDAEIKVIDFFNYFNKKLKAYIVNDAYLKICRYLLNSYNIFYRGYQRLNPFNRYISPASSLVQSETPKLLKEIASFKPDAIVCTHFYTAIAVSEIRLSYKVDVPIFAVLTDFTVHPFWESSIGIDYIFVPNEELGEKMIEKGFRSEQIRATGIPTFKKFAEERDKNEVRSELRLEHDIFTILLFSGGFGIGDASKIIRQLLKVNRKFNLVVINGRNRKSYENTDKLARKYKGKLNITNLGFTYKVAEYMSACDITIGKAGGITTNESLNKQIPAIIPCALPEQERCNMVYITKNNAGIYAPTQKQLVHAIRKCIDEPQFVEAMKENQKKISKPMAVSDVVDIVTNSGSSKLTSEEIHRILAEKNYKILSKIRREKRRKHRESRFFYKVVRIKKRKEAKK